LNHDRIQFGSGKSKESTMNTFGPGGWRRPAFTLIELLVAITVISILVAIILPAVQQAREASRRVQCRNNLKQIGIALQNYIQMRGVYPPGYVYNPKAGAPFMGWSWETMLLPMLDQAPLYNSLSSQLDQGVPASGWVLSQSELSGFRCPSDVGESLVANVDIPGINSSTGQPGATMTAEIGFARSNYFGVAGYWDNAGLATGLNASGTAGVVTAKTFRGTFGENSSILPMQIRDGTSNTIIVGERYSPVAATAVSVTTNSALTTTSDTSGGNCPQNGSSDSTSTDTSISVATESATTGDGIWLAAVSRANSTSGAIVTGQAYVLGDTAASGVPATAVGQNAGVSQRGLTTGFGSLHAGGAFYLLGDGSVRYINDSIDLATYRSLGAINDGGPIFDF
jgi:prepilin-type N-terminal cleavage/methylation domain-containing protein